MAPRIDEQLAAIGNDVFQRHPHPTHVTGRKRREMNGVLMSALLPPVEVEQGLTGCRGASEPLGPSRLSLAVHPMNVQVFAPPEWAGTLLANTAAQWQHLGETEPRWSVLTAEAFLQEHLAENLESFYASGLAELATLDATLARAGLGERRFQTCVELGCGVGRVTHALARRYATTGVDVSAAHLAIANHYVQSLGLPSVRLAQLLSIEGIKSLGRFDVAYSRLVLQHNPPPVMAALIAALLAALNPGGVAYFQIPTFKVGYRFETREYLESSQQTHMEMHYLPQATLFKIIADAGCRLLDIREDDSIGMSSTALSNTLLVERPLNQDPAPPLTP